jgi:putative lipase involved disintegration of autophagic bodies
MEFTVSHKPALTPQWSNASRASRVRYWSSKLDSGELKPHDIPETETIRITHKETREPDITDTQTILSLAKMTFNSYTEPENKDWMPIPPYNVTDRFGWTANGIRGYVFVDEVEDLIVIAVKGTSLLTPIGGGPTGPKDKYNVSFFLFIPMKSYFLIASLALFSHFFSSLYRTT